MSVLITTLYPTMVGTNHATQRFFWDSMQCITKRTQRNKLKPDAFCFSLPLKNSTV